MENINFIQNGSSKYVGHQAHFPTLSPKNKKKLLLKSLSYFSKNKMFWDGTFQFQGKKNYIFLKKKNSYISG